MSERKENVLLFHHRFGLNKEGGIISQKKSLRRLAVIDCGKVFVSIGLSLEYGIPKRNKSAYKEKGGGW